jgi:hypothetical protein
MDSYFENANDATFSPYATGVVAAGINSTYKTFQQAFPQCNSTIGSIKWIIEQFQQLFCPPE